MSTIYQQLLTDHFPFLRKLAYWYTKDAFKAEDLFQSVMVKIVKSEASFELGTNFKAWVASIMRNEYIDEYRKNKKKYELAKSIDRRFLFSNVGYAENDGESNLEIVLIEEAVKKLGPLYSKPLRMHVEGFMYHEIAREMRLPLGTVKSRIFLARKQLRKELNILPV